MYIDYYRYVIRHSTVYGGNLPFKGRTIRYLMGGWANTKKTFAHRKNPEKKYREQQTY
jgi:hypothetical protein